MVGKTTEKRGSMAADNSYDRRSGAARYAGNDGYRTAQTRRSQAYMHDNTARQLQELPERRYRRAPQRRRRPQPKPVRMTSISGVSFLFLFSAVVVTLVFCFFYLQSQNTLTKMKKEAVTLQSQIADRKESNQETYQKITDSVDLAEVYEIATGELGMVQAVDNQVYQYKNKKSDMVKQYADIPDAKK